VIDPKKSTFIDRMTTNYIRWIVGQDNNEWNVVDRMLESHAKKLREKYIHVSCQVKKGDPKHILVKEAESWKADCIFVGARGLTHLKRFFMGGVSTAVAARAHCSVEVIRDA
jgi:nucleotide-binding universal stress UspA family protein